MYKTYKLTNITVYLYIYMLYDSMTKTSMMSTLWHYATTRSISYAHISMVSTRIPAIYCVPHPLARSRLIGLTTWITRYVMLYTTILHTYMYISCVRGVLYCMYVQMYSSAYV